MCVPQSAELLFQFMLVRVGISVQSRKVNVRVIFRVSINSGSVTMKYQTGAICILIRVEQDIRAIVFVVTSQDQLRTISAHDLVSQHTREHSGTGVISRCLDERIAKDRMHALLVTFCYVV